MRFLLEFVTCCRGSVRPVVSTNPPRTEEKRSLMPELCSEGGDLLCRRKRRRFHGSRSVARERWRPSLCAISEDNVAVIAVAGKVDSAVRSEGKLTGKAGSNAKVRRRGYSDDCRQTPVPVVIPSFSPTPFLF